MRAYSTSRDVRAGCFNCHGSGALWRGKNAQGVAVRHHDAKGHQTWVDVTLSIVYGQAKATTAQAQKQLQLASPPASPPKRRKP